VAKGLLVSRLLHPWTVLGIIIAVGTQVIWASDAVAGMASPSGPAKTLRDTLWSVLEETPEVGAMFEIGDDRLVLFLLAHWLRSR